MDGSILLQPEERKTLLHVFKTANTHDQRLRALILLSLDAGFAWTVISGVLFTSGSTINRWRHRFQAGGLQAVIDAPRRRHPSRLAT